MTQEEIDLIMAKYDNLQYGYTTKMDVITLISESLDVPEHIAEWMLNKFQEAQELDNQLREEK